ncbi:alkaline phosphatase D family protein [Streptomyces smyrnaeus]|uniref:alkaline phosphatase D family protein n=1 Tax=Streptomyces smyrnaeus TaxID=1387713 RepID=UPI0036C03C84
MTSTHSARTDSPTTEQAPPHGPVTAPRRRAVVAAGAAGAALLPLAGAAPSAGAAEAGPSFAHGVASGDPLPDGVLLWTRVTPGPGAVPGSGKGAPVEVDWEVARDREFGTVVARGTVRAEAATDHTVKADVRGLRPATAYFFRFTAEGAHSPTGRTRTAPAESAQVDRLRLGVVSCANYEGGYFASYRHLAARTDLDAVLHLGDYLYEYGHGEYPTGDAVVRTARPTHEIVSLADYRVRHGHYKSDPDLQAMHAAHPLIAIWDDHELADNAWSGGAVNHDPATEGDWAQRTAAAKQAYFEWMPVRPSTAGTTFRKLRFGSLAELHLLDLRSFRDAQPTVGDGKDIDDPDRTLTGRRQLDWLKKGLAGSPARWKLVGNPVMISQVAFGSVPAKFLGPLAACLGVPREGLAVNTDQWDGYTDDRRELLTHLRDNRVTDTVFLTGDIHMNWANEVPLRAADHPHEPPVATEFVITSVTSDNLDDTLRVAPDTLSGIAEAAVRAANRHVRWVDMDSHGFGVLDVDATRTQMDYYVLSDKTDAHATATLRRSYRTTAGSQRVERTYQPVR